MATLFDGACRGLDHAGDGERAGNVYKVAPPKDRHRRARAVGHSPRDCWVKLAVLCGNDHVARLIVPGGDGELGAEGVAQYGHLRARHKFGGRLGKIGAHIGGKLRLARAARGESAVDR